LIHGEPIDVVFLKHFKDVTFGSVQLILVDGSQMDDEVQITPRIVVVFDVMSETSRCLLFEDFVLISTYEAN
jgi:hypothetical protein